MAKGINYGQLTQKAFRQVIAEVLTQVARDGLPGKHHFFITFDTTHPGVDMAPNLRARYPKEITIVLQDWFADLAVMKDRFSVTLNFGNVPEAMVVPFEAIKTFVDPSVEYGLRFDAHEQMDDRRRARGHRHSRPSPRRSPSPARARSSASTSSASTDAGRPHRPPPLIWNTPSSRSSLRRIVRSKSS